MNHREYLAFVWEHTSMTVISYGAGVSIMLDEGFMICSGDCMYVEDECMYE
jgi:hypothetical protein